MIDSRALGRQLYSIQENLLLESIGNALSIGLDGDEVSKWVIPRIAEIREKTTEEAIELLSKERDAILLETKNGFDYVKNEISEFWGYYTDQFLYLIRQYYEIGALCNKLLMSSQEEIDKYLYVVNSRIHALSCRVANEVFSLLSQGFSDGAFSHVRTMYEYEIVSRAIWESPDPMLTAKKYDEHRICDEVRKYKALEKVNKLSLFDVAEYEKAKAHVSELKKKYGKDYETPWGWANHLISGRPSFGALNRVIADSDGADLYYWSSSQLHASSIGLNGAIGPSEEGWTLVSGPTDIVSSDSVVICLHALDVIVSNYANMLKDHDEYDDLYHGIDIWLCAIFKIGNKLQEEMAEQSRKFMGVANELMSRMATR